MLVVVRRPGVELRIHIRQEGCRGAASWVVEEYLALLHVHAALSAVGQCKGWGEGAERRVNLSGSTVAWGVVPLLSWSSNL
jgi:hypothetical protein